MKLPTEVTLDSNSLKHIDIVVRIRRTVGYRVRLRAAILLLRLAGWVSGINITVEQGEA